MTAYGKLLDALGYAVIFYLDDNYLRFTEFSDVGTPLSRTKPIPDGLKIAIFYNSAAQNPTVAARMKASGATVLYVFHEPLSFWDWNYMRTEGLRQNLRFQVSVFFSIRLLRQCSVVIVPSEYAREQYEENYARHNPNIFTMPLLFHDEVEPERITAGFPEKKFFGFIGSVGKGHGFDWFVEFAKYAIRSGSTIPFKIATRTDLTNLFRNDEEFAHYAKDGKIQVQHGHMLSNSEINEHYLSCFCVWNVYRRSTQSGVLPRCFMAGTPVLASRIGSFPEFVQQGLTGEFVDYSEGLPRMLEVAEIIRNRFPVYSQQCRNAFLRTFHYKANASRLAAVLNRICPQERGLNANGLGSIL